MSSEHCYALPRGNSNIYQIHQGDLEGDGSIDLRVDRSTKLFSLIHSFYWVHCGKNSRKIPLQITDAADHNSPVTEFSDINIPI